ncbi:MAG: cation transporter [Pseudomonadota bacterium]|nr:cation transporter [Pseudomonadota bacterium]
MSGIIRLRIAGMSCGHCVKRVTDALSEVPGVERVRSVDLGSGEAIVEGPANLEALLAAVTSAGYEASLTS